MTFSIIGIDKKNKEIGIACFSKAFALGGIVPSVDLDSGAVATQSYPNVAYKKQATALMKKESPEKVIQELIKKDKEKEFRQVIIMNRKGKSAGFTGLKNVEWAGHKSGHNCIAAGNMLVGENVIAILIATFEKTKGSLSKKLINALVEAEKIGGDKRKEKFNSAAIIVEKRNKGIFGLDNRYIDLRVDNSENSIAELTNLLKVREKMEDWYSKNKTLK
jgi:uncharacterized Ntn-hydrolase superfamily protein